MASLYGVNAAKLVANTGVKIAKGQSSGRVRNFYDELTIVANVNAINDTIDFGSLLPAGARIVGGKVKGPSTGTTGIIKLGYTDNGSDVADDDAFGPTFDFGGQAVEAEINGAGVGKTLAKATQVQATFTEATDAAAGKKIQVWINYVVD